MKQINQQIKLNLKIADFINNIANLSSCIGIFIISHILANLWSSHYMAIPETDTTTFFNVLHNIQRNI